MNPQHPGALQPQQVGQAQHGQMQHDPMSPFHTQHQTPMVQQVSSMEATVPYDAEPPQPVQQELPIPVEGVGIDARSQPDPVVTAEQQTLSVAAAPGAAQGRVALLQQALRWDLCKFLVMDVLENPTLGKVKDPASTKVHAVELLQLLTMDPGYGAKFTLILEEIPAWKKYKSQDHSLFITGAEQRTDYFLTDGRGGEATKLLTN